MEISLTEENYLKAIYALYQQSEGHGANTSKLSEHLNNKAASVTDMLKKLSDKKLIHYKKYKAVSLTKQGEKMAIAIIRKHRLWEVFLMEKLKFRWDEVHDMAEQLEHIKSDELVQRLDMYLGNPKFDPHGDPIPDANGLLPLPRSKTLSQYTNKNTCIFVGVNDHSPAFLQHLSAIGLKIGDRIKIEENNPYDGSFKIKLARKESFFISQKVATNLLVEFIS